MSSPLQMSWPHQRFDPLRGRWVLVSAERTRRPWQGHREPTPSVVRPSYDPDCYLCPGNVRAGGARNPEYADTFAFTNDFPALLPDTPPVDATRHPLLQAHSQPGTCRVLCFSPHHDLTPAEMTVEQLASVVGLWVDQFQELSATYEWVQIFENQGASMGASNPHPHGQIWASTTVPSEPATEDRLQREYLAEHDSVLLVEYAALELDRDERVVAANDAWVAVVPFWAAWPFETLVIPRRHASRLTDLTAAERRQLAALLQALLTRYDNLFEHPFPYSMGWHGAPSGDAATGDHWQLHAHFYPPLLRSPTVRKWMVGYEMLADSQRDLSPEEAARRLRDLPTSHYRTTTLQPDPSQPAGRTEGGVDA